jgi:hypothetical protein
VLVRVLPLVRVVPRVGVLAFVDIGPFVGVPTGAGIVDLVSVIALMSGVHLVLAGDLPRGLAPDVVAAGIPQRALGHARPFVRGLRPPVLTSSPG